MAKDSSSNLGGTKTMSNGRNGATIIKSYGRDNSNYNASTSMAREGSEGFGGGVDDLSHSLSGNRANQMGE